MTKVPVSDFLLERYHLGEVTPEEKLRVEEAFSGDNSLSAALADLDQADNDFFKKFPKEKFLKSELNMKFENSRPIILSRNKRIPPLVWGFCAAALVLVVGLPVFILKNQPNENYTDRIKGASGNDSSMVINKGAVNNCPIELSVYMKDDLFSEGVKLADKSSVHEGNTVQLVYRVLNNKHGVIFSIDGRSSVTLHYPYNTKQTTQLVSGRSVPLDEAYTLDDAPDYEIFFFVAGDTPMNVINILDTAEQLALQIEGRPEEASKMVMNTFNEYEVNVFTVIKE